MGNYQNVTAGRPAGVEKKKAYLVGAGIASLAAAAYLIRDGHMAGGQITILEQLDIAGGSLDGSGNATDGYLVRGGREMEEHYECTWDLFSRVPSIIDPERTVLEEIREINLFDPNEATNRIINNCGVKDPNTSLGLSHHNVRELTRLSLATEQELGATTVEEYFSPSFLETYMWCYWRSMFAFQTWHSVVEMRRYMQRFMHLLPGMSLLKDILFTKYNQYESLALPLQTWLKAEGVVFDLGTQVTDLDIEIVNAVKTVTGIHLLRNGLAETIATTGDDLVFVTNGSMTENSTVGSLTEPAILNHEAGGCWTLWKNMALKDPAFGRPEVFCSDIDKTKWLSFTTTAKGAPMADLLAKITGRDPHSGKGVTGCIMTIRDSNWLMSATCSRQPHYVDQPDDVVVVWAYGLFPDNVGDFIPKKMSDCNGEELLSELLYHWGAKDQIPEIMKTVKVIPCMMPYITSQFMPRVKGDRPDVVPVGSRNLAFLGQFAELPDDCVFTVEYSVRSAMTAVYTLLALDKTPPEVYPSKYDVRVVAKAAETMYDGHVPAERLISHFLKDTSLEGLI
jgi:oleate hydratase